MLLAGGDWLQCAFALFGVGGVGGVAVLWLAWALWGTLAVFFVSCVVREADPACWWELMDDETSSHYIFLFMLLLIPFLVIGLSIKANILININCLFLSPKNACYDMISDSVLHSYA